MTDQAYAVLLLSMGTVGFVTGWPRAFMVYEETMEQARIRGIRSSRWGGGK